MCDHVVRAQPWETRLFGYSESAVCHRLWYRFFLFELTESFVSYGGLATLLYEYSLSAVQWLLWLNGCEMGLG